MRNRTVGLALLMMLAVAAIPQLIAADPKSEVEAVLTSLHTAASEADAERYFGLFAGDAVFMGTDASERWSVDEFKAFAEPYFSQGRGWTYVMTERHISLSADGNTAWFDEMLQNASYGTCRGSGVLTLTPAGWRIVQYNLSFPIPNDLAREITALIKQASAKP